MTTTRMTGADAAWLGIDAPDNLMMVTAVLRLQGPVDWARFADVVQQRMVARYPTFRRRALPATSPFEQPVWSDDPEFDLGDHLVHGALVTDTESGLADFVSDLLGTPLDMTRSPWQFHLVDGPMGDSTVVARLHHCIADGIALASVLLSLTDSTDSTRTATDQHRTAHARASQRDRRRGPRGGIVRRAEKVPAMSPQSPASTSAPGLRCAMPGALCVSGSGLSRQECASSFAARDPRTRCTVAARHPQRQRAGRDRSSSTGSRTSVAPSG